MGVLSEFGPLEYAIVGNGALLLLLFIILAYTIHRLRRVSLEKKRLRRAKRAAEVIGPSLSLTGHENFSTLCGLNSQQGNMGNNVGGTLQHAHKKSVRITEKEGGPQWAPPPPTGGPFLLSSPSTAAGASPLWIAYPHVQGAPYFPGSHFATLNIPVKKGGKGGRCQRAHSCRVGPVPLHSTPPHNTQNKKLNLEQFYGKY